MVSIETVSIVIAAVSIVAGVYLSLQSRKQELQTRQAELFMSLYNRWSSRVFRENTQDLLLNWTWADYDDFMAKYGPLSLRNLSRWTTVVTFFEGVGVLVEQDLIDLRLVDRLLRNSIVGVWEKLEPIIVEYRKNFSAMHDMRKHYPQYDSFEYLYDLVVGLEKHSVTIS